MSLRLNKMGRMMSFSRSALILSLTLLTCSARAERFKYSELQIKDYDEMHTALELRITKAQKALQAADKDGEAPPTPDQGSVELLREGLLLVLSRPNQDNMLAKLMPDIRKELNSVNAFEDSLDSVVSEALDSLGNEKLAVVYKSTYLLVLENFLNEFRPEIRDKEELRKIFAKIRDSGVTIPEPVRKDLKLRSMLKIESPSERAKKILDGLTSTKKSKAK